MKTKEYFHNLDGWRTISFLLVFFYHSFHTENSSILNSETYIFVTKKLFINGNIGVNFFFVLSGFLITYFVIQEKLITGKIQVVNFWTRRILRIWPLYFFCVVFGFLIFPFLKIYFGQIPAETAHLLNYITFTSNFDMINNGLPDASILGVLWSVAIEEQFYLIWPILLILVPSKRFIYLFASLILINIGYRIFNSQDIQLEMHSLSCMGDLVIGSLSAYLVLTKEKFLIFMKNLPKWAIMMFYFGLFSFLFFRTQISNVSPVLLIFERLILAIFIAVIILEQNYAVHSFFKMKNFKMLSRLGKYTYSMYCLHFVGILITLQLTKLLKFNTELWQVLIFETLLSMILTIVMAYLSYQYLEKPVLKLKKRFS
ncbi:MAG: acyltransferase [Crocinitomicaceae bacterium]